jgi:AcrR family transcriptional regulator
MKTPSLYWYFDSKHAIYDAMFVQGNEELLKRVALQCRGTTPRTLLRAMGRTLVGFSVEDPARYQLLFQRSIPDFEPSPEAYLSAVAVYEHMRAKLASIGITRQSHLDMWTALVGGISAQQTSNDPGGDRWLRLVDPMVDMFWASVGAQKRPAGKRRGRPRPRRAVK